MYQSLKEAGQLGGIEQGESLKQMLECLSKHIQGWRNIR